MEDTIWLRRERGPSRQQNRQFYLYLSHLLYAWIHVSIFIKKKKCVLISVIYLLEFIDGKHIESILRGQTQVSLISIGLTLCY